MNIKKTLHLVFDIIVFSMLLIPSALRIFKNLKPGLFANIKVQPIPTTFYSNSLNGQGLKGKLKGVLMDTRIAGNNFGTWYNDNFTLKSELLKVFHYVKENILFNDPFPGKVIKGKDGWLFAGDFYDKGFSEQLGYERMKDEDIKELVQIIDYYQQWCASLGIRYVFMPIQGKAGFYHEYVPLKKSGLLTTLDLLVKQLEPTQVVVVDVRKSLEKGRQKQLYLKEDTHWNGNGAWLAYNQLLDTLQCYIPELMKLKDNEVFTDTIYPSSMDLAMLLNRTSPYPNLYVVPKIVQAKLVENKLKVPDDYTYVAKSNYEFRFENPAANKKALIFRDSYFVHLQPLVIEAFKESVLIWSRIPDTALIISEHPDFVIHQISERLINDCYEEIKAKNALKIKPDQ